jgi:HEAT repeat protein
LRNRRPNFLSAGTDDALEALMLGLADDSALLRHEICYVLGQLRKAKAIPVLVSLLEGDRDVMVRHEAAEALGAIADPALLDKEQFDHVLLVLKVSKAPRPPLSNPIAV